jgi:hypothetical protein
MENSQYQPIQALDETILPLEIFERIFNALDATSLLAFGQTCKFFLEESDKDDHWHRLFDTTMFSVVPTRLTTWQERFQCARLSILGLAKSYKRT